MEEEYGRQISAQEAETIMFAREAIVNECRDNLIHMFNEEGNNKAERYYGSKFNGFIFSRDLVQRFFEEDKNKEIYLVVLLGAHPQKDHPFEEGDPTVMLVGCTKKVDADGKISFQSLGLAKPANEHPPRTFFPKFPLVESTTIEFFVE